MANSTEVLTIDSLERLTNSREGGPRWRVTFTNARSAITDSGSQVGHVIDNSEFQNVPLEVTFNSKGKITAVRTAE